MKIEPFATENFFARYEFTTPHLLSVSDCETMSIGELMEMANLSMAEISQLRLGYTESLGHPDLRNAVANLYENITSDQVVILGSPVEGIYLTMQALINPGDHVIVLTPAYDALINVAEHLSQNVQRWQLLPTESGWRLDFDTLEEWLTEDTRLIVANFPHNPTGYMPRPDEYSRLLNLARENGTWLYCDEIYRGLEIGETMQLPSAADHYERSIVLSGLSKTYGLPGLRSGWLVIPDDSVREEIVNWKHYTSICPPAPSELLALIALNLGDVLPARSREIVENNINYANAFYSRWDEFFDWRPPQAGSVALVGIDVTSAEAYCHELAEKAGVLLLPGSFLGFEDRYVRFGFGRKSFQEALNHYDQHLREGMKL
jgi:aspartate/methionine/tyrosine aminotransferase